MFRPLAWTKTLAVGFSSLLAITLVPPLMLLFIRGRLRPESSNPVSRVTQALYLPVLKLCLRFPKNHGAAESRLSGRDVSSCLQARQPVHAAAFEGAALYMPTALPGISIGQATQLLQEQDRVLRSFPEVESVFGSIGRSDSATDNAPLDMYDTTVMLKPRERMAPGNDLRKADLGNGRQTPVPWLDQHMDHADRESSRHGAHRNQDAGGHQDSRPEPGGHRGSWAREFNRFSARCRRCGRSLPSASRRDSTSTWK